MRKYLIFLTIIAMLGFSSNVMAADVFATFSSTASNPPTGGGGVLFDDYTISGSLTAIYMDNGDIDFIVKYTGHSWWTTADPDVVTVCSIPTVVQGTAPPFQYNCASNTGITIDFVNGGMPGPAGNQWVDVRFK